MSKVKKSNKKHTKHSLADVTINDYANSSSCKERIKKWTSNVSNVVQNQLADERSWDEKIDEYDGDFVEKVNKDGSVSYVIEKVQQKKKKKSTIKNKEEPSGNVYHIDIWFLISEYIRPEDIGRFAGICKTSYEVVCTEKFWYSLYKRYYKSIPNMPKALQPNNLLRRHSLRTSVIRALHYLYRPFTKRLHSLKNTHLDRLIKTQCISMWHQKSNFYWSYYFKMKIPNHQKSKTQQPRDIFELLDDMWANQDEDCQILDVSCEQQIPISPVLGLSLLSAQRCLASGNRSYKVMLWFGSGVQSFNSSTGGNGSTLIILEPVINIKVLDWWHPYYPHSCSMVHLFDQE